ncbi:MAG: DnaJ domain-containing protein [Rhodocyclaceae bacterium]|nr:DnaJ domain-containing protein [Rhodocyclaceae bacterium]
MTFRDYYAVLGVERGASAEAIRAAYRKLARKYHPDVSKEPDADVRMKALNEAYAVLSDPEKRAEYDAFGTDRSPSGGFSHAPGRGPASGQDGAGVGAFSEIFEHIFGRESQGPRRRAAPQFDGRGEDHRVRVELDLDDSFHGTTRQITLRSPSIDARGHVSMRERTLEVKIPRGVREGQVIRLAGQGHPGFGEGPAGDLQLEVHFRPHPTLQAEGRHLRMRLPVAPWEAALGAEVPVSLPDGALRVRIPEGSQGGRQLRIRGRGLPASPPGDLLLDLVVVLPPASDPKARVLYRRMAEELDFDPRSGVRQG